MHHAQFVRELFAFTSDPANGVLRLIMRWHEGWSVRHFRGLMVLFPGGVPVAVWAKINGVVGGFVVVFLILPQGAMHNSESMEPWISCADLFSRDMAFSPTFWLRTERWKDFQGTQNR